MVFQAFSEVYPTEPDFSLYCVMVEIKGTGPASFASSPGSAPFAAKVKAFAASLREALADAQAALRQGEAADAERQARAVSALVKAARETAEFEDFIQAQPTEHDVEDLRAELRRRLARFVEADLAGAPPEVLERIALEGLS